MHKPIRITMPDVQPGNRLTLALGGVPYEMVRMLNKAITVLEWRVSPLRIDVSLDDDGRFTYVSVWPGNGDSAVYIWEMWQHAGLYPSIGTDQNGFEYVWCRMGVA